MAYDITNSIMDYFIEKFPDVLNSGATEEDPDWLKSIERGPLQDDPTKRAVFLTIEPDKDVDPQGYRQPVGSQRKNRLHIPDAAPDWEVGGGFLMINYFKITGWTPRQSTKNDAYNLAAKMLRRIERGVQIFQRKDIMQGIETDDGFETTGGQQQIYNLNGSTYSLVGGENEWYGKVHISFGVYSKIDNQYWK